MLGVSILVKIKYLFIVFNSYPKLFNFYLYTKKFHKNYELQCLRTKARIQRINGVSQSPNSSDRTAIQKFHNPISTANTPKTRRPHTLFVVIVNRRHNRTAPHPSGPSPMNQYPVPLFTTKI